MQARRVTLSGGGRGDGDCSVEGPSAIGERGHAAMSLMPDADGTVSGSLLVSILSSFLIKMIPWHLGSSSSPLLIDDTIALDCILNSCCNLCVPF